MSGSIGVGKLERVSFQDKLHNPLVVQSPNLNQVIEPSINVPVYNYSLNESFDITQIQQDNDLLHII